MMFRDGGLVNCGNCEFALERHANAELAAKAEAAGHSVPPLHCLRHPVVVPKSPTDACGDHSELIARRNMELADMIAIGIVKQQRVSAKEDPLTEKP